MNRKITKHNNQDKWAPYVIAVGTIAFSVVLGYMMFFYEPTCKQRVPADQVSCDRFSYGEEVLIDWARVQGHEFYKNCFTGTVIQCSPARESKVMISCETIYRRYTVRLNCSGNVDSVELRFTDDELVRLGN